MIRKLCSGNDRKLLLLAIIITSFSIITLLAVNYTVTGRITYFYAYHWESGSLVGVRFITDCRIDSCTPAPDYVKFRYAVYIYTGKSAGINLNLSEDIPEGQPLPLFGYVKDVVWSVHGWTGTGTYHSDRNWIPSNPLEVEYATRAYVWVYVDDDYKTGKDDEDGWGTLVDSDVTIIYNYPP